MLLSKYRWCSNLLSRPHAEAASTRIAEAQASTPIYAAAKVSAAIPARVFNGMSAMIFLRRAWKILRFTTSIRLPRRQFYFGPKTTIVRSQDRPQTSTHAIPSPFPVISAAANYVLKPKLRVDKGRFSSTVATHQNGQKARY
jgi:hypothetical protein